MPIEIRTLREDDLRAAMTAAECAFGADVGDDDWEREQQVLSPSRTLAGYDGTTLLFRTELPPFCSEVF